MIQETRQPEPFIIGYCFGRFQMSQRFGSMTPRKAERIMLLLVSGMSAGMNLDAFYNGYEDGVDGDRFRLNLIVSEGGAK